MVGRALAVGQRAAEIGLGLLVLALTAFLVPLAITAGWLKLRDAWEVGLAVIVVLMVAM